MVCPSSRKHKYVPEKARLDLLLEHFFDLSESFLNFAAILFGVAFGPQVRIVRDSAGRLFDFAFHFMNTAFNLILRTGVHCFLLGPSLGRLNLPERWLVDPHATVIIPFHFGIIFVRSLNRAKCSIRLPEVAQTLDAISRSKFLAGGRGLGERWSLCPARVWDRASV